VQKNVAANKEQEKQKNPEKKKSKTTKINYESPTD
jgi:hypothetical protein